MRVVADTNILVSAVIKPSGLVGQVLLRLRQGEFTLLFSSSLLAELADVLNRPRLRHKYSLTTRDIETVLRLIVLRGELIQPQRRFQICRDPRDDPFLEVAVAGQADVIVSGDGDLLVLHPFEGIPIMTAREFLQMLDASRTK